MHYQSVYGEQSTKTHMKECIDNCLNSFRVCEEAATKAIDSINVNVEHVKLLQAAAAICRTSAEFMMIESNYHYDTCGLCAKICRACAKECENGSEAWMQECYEACTKCAYSCEGMSKMGH